MIDTFIGNWICWAILVLALVCYQQLWLEYLDFKKARANTAINSGADSEFKEHIKQEFSGVLIGALPLLGLLGTIIGLLDSFTNIASVGANNETVSGGIADALLTTQLGLICAIPGWLLQAYIRSHFDKPQRTEHPAAQAYELEQQ